MITGRYQGHVIDVVTRAVVNGEKLHVHETATRIAAETGGTNFLDAIADALVQEGVRRQARLDMNEPTDLERRRRN